MKKKNYFFEIATMIVICCFLVAIALFANAFLKAVFSTIVAKVIAALVLASVFWRYSGALIRAGVNRLSVRTVIFFVVLVFMVIALSSCASTRSSYSAVGGKLTNLQKHRTENYIAVQRMQRIENTEAMYTDLDFKRLKSQPVKTDSIKGYLGKIINLSRWQNIQFNVSRVESPDKTILSETLAPGQQISRYLLPGRYLVTVYINGKLKDVKDFPVGAELKGFFGELLHWYIYRGD